MLRHRGVIIIEFSAITQSHLLDHLAETLKSKMNAFLISATLIASSYASYSYQKEIPNTTRILPAQETYNLDAVVSPLPTDEYLSCRDKHEAIQHMLVNQDQTHPRMRNVLNQMVHELYPNDASNDILQIITNYVAHYDMDPIFKAVCNQPTASKLSALLSRKKQEL